MDRDQWSKQVFMTMRWTFYLCFRVLKGTEVPGVGPGPQVEGTETGTGDQETNQDVITREDKSWEVTQGRTSLSVGLS